MATISVPLGLTLVPAEIVVAYYKEISGSAALFEKSVGLSGNDLFKPPALEPLLVLIKPAANKSIAAAAFSLSLGPPWNCRNSRGRRSRKNVYVQVRQRFPPVHAGHQGEC